MEDEYIKLRTYVDFDTVDDWYYAAAGPAMAILKELLPTVTFTRKGDDINVSVGHVDLIVDTAKMKMEVVWKAPLWEWQAHCACEMRAVVALGGAAHG